MGSYPDFTISFTLIQEDLQYDINDFSWRSILRFTDTDNNCCNHGDRSPAIFFKPNSLKMRVTYVLKNGKLVFMDALDELKLHQKYRIKIRGFDNKIQLHVNDELNGEMHVPRSDRIFKNPLKVYASDKFYPAATGINVQYLENNPGVYFN